MGGSHNALGEFWVPSSDFLLPYPKKKSTNHCSFQEIHFASQFNVKPTHLVVSHILTCSRYAHMRFDSWYWVIEMTFESCTMVPLYHSKLSWLQCARVSRQNNLALWCLALPALLRQNCMRATSLKCSPGLNGTNLRRQSSPSYKRRYYAPATRSHTNHYMAEAYKKDAVVPHIRNYRHIRLLYPK